MVNLEDISTDSLNLPIFREKKLEVSVLRLDKIHPEISGNKWFKLKYYLETARLQHKKRLISFGGPYSNHIVALACAAGAAGFSSTGFIRGEKPPHLSASLFAALEYGMGLEFLSRERYRIKEEASFLLALQEQYPEALIIPEGGCGEPGIRGAEEILSFSDTSIYSHICCAAGTGATLAGIANASRAAQKITGISVLRGTKKLEPLQISWINDPEKLCRLNLIHDYHFGGYAKKSAALLNFMNEVYEVSGIPTDFVYTAKLLYGIADLARVGYFPKESRVLIIHSGGLAGNRSLPSGTLHF